MAPRSELGALVDGCLMASFPGTVAPAWLLDRIADGLGSVCLFGSNVSSPAQLAELVGSLRATRPGIVISVDEEGGDVTRLHAATGSPHAGAATLGAADDEELTRAVARDIGAELAAVDIDLDLAPCVDVNTDAGNPVIGVRSFGPEPELVARHGAAFVQGLQATGVRACAKHFPGHGDTAVDSHLGLPTIGADLATLHRRDLIPFRAVIAAGVAAVMPSHLLVPALDSDPASVSAPILRGLLRDELGFDGAIVTDALDMGGILQRGGMPAATVAALVAGADLCCLGAAIDAPGLDAVRGAIIDAVRQGLVSEARLADAARRASRLRADASTATPGVDDGAASDLVARRAVRVEGPGALVPATGWLVVTCRDAPGIAVGDVPWSAASAVVATDPTSCAVDASPSTSVDDVLARANGRPLAVVVRDAHRHSWQRELAERLAAARPAVVIVEMGWPGVSTAPVRIVTHGAARPNAHAVADLLVRRAGG
jgi:beta-N-acetylhexosaminidase